MLLLLCPSFDATDGVFLEEMSIVAQQKAGEM